MEDYLTLNDAATVLKVSITSLYNWRAQGFLKMSQPYGPRLNLLSRNELDRLLRERLDNAFGNLMKTQEGKEVLVQYLKELALHGEDGGLSDG